METSKRTSTLVMANYNHAHYLPESLGGIFSQTRAIDEVLVIDDASTDNSLEVLAALQAKESRLRVLRNETNKGAVFSVNRGLREACGDLVCFHSADDFLSPHFFEFSVRMLEVFPNAGLCTSYFSTYNESQNQLSNGELHWADTPCYLSPGDLARIKIGGSIPGHASIYDKQSILEAGGLIPELRWHCDWFMNHVIAARRGICFIPAALSFLRIVERGGSYGSGRLDWGQQKEVVRQVLELLLSETYRDVIPFFQGCGILSVIYPDICRLFCEEPNLFTKEQSLLFFMMLKEGDQHKMRRFFEENKGMFPEMHQMSSVYL